MERVRKCFYIASNFISENPQGDKEFFVDQIEADLSQEPSKEEEFELRMWKTLKDLTVLWIEKHIKLERSQKQLKDLIPSHKEKINNGVRDLTNLKISARENSISISSKLSQHQKIVQEAREIISVLEPVLKIHQCAEAMKEDDSTLGHLLGQMKSLSQ